MKILQLRFNLASPWDYFKNLGCLHGRLTRYKAWEIEHTYYSGSLLDVDIEWSIGTDHAGFTLALGILGYGVGFRIYDTRHWNTTLNTWVAYD